MFNKKMITKLSIAILPVLVGLILSFNNVVTIEKREAIMVRDAIGEDNADSVQNKKEVQEVIALEPENVEEDITEKDMIIISESGLNVRSNPDLDAPILDTLPFASPVKILDIDVDDKWYKIEDGYISTKYVMEYDEAIKENIVTDDDIERYKRIYDNYEMELNIDVIGKSGLNINDIRSYTSKHKGLSGIEKALIDAEYEYGINAFFTLAVAALESAHGNSDIAVFKNNLFGMNAHDKDPYNLAFHYDSKHDSTMDFARRIKAYYIDEGLKTLEDIQSKYCPTNDEWDETVTDVMKSVYKYAVESRE